MTIITKENIDNYFQNRTVRHFYYTESVERYNDLNDHYVDKVNMEVITEKRPNEGQEIKDYREKIAVPVTKRYLWKIISYLSGIRKAKDWNVYWETDESLPANITEKESLKEYLEEKMPLYGDITNWAFSQLLTQYVLDANAVVLTMPSITDVTPVNEFSKPFPVIYNSDQIIDYKEDDYYVLKSKDVVFYRVGDNLERGCSYYVVTSTVIERYDQTSPAGDFRQTYSQPNKVGYLPIRHLFGVVTSDNGYNILGESRLSPMVPYLKEAMRYYNDYQAEMTLHVFSQYWTRMVQTCIRCNGTGQVISKSKTGTAVNIECKTCKGAGSLLPSPFQTIGIKKNIDGTFPDGVPAGYIEKNVEIPKILYTAFENMGYNALSSVNFQNVDQVPTSQSGVAKEVDREQQNITMHSIAEDLVRVMDGVTMDVCNWRYMDAVPDKETRLEMLPDIAVPDRFDLTSTTQQLSDIQALVNSKADPVILSAVQADFMDKYFASNKPVAERGRAIMELNPFAGKTAEEIGFLSSMNLIDKRDAAVYAYLPILVDMAMEEDSGFLQNDHVTKLTKLRELVAGLSAEVKTDIATQDTVDSLGKLPLALQQLALAATRAENDLGDKNLAKLIRDKMKELTGDITIE